MDIPITLLTLIENGIVGVLLGASTVAVLSYALSLKYGYPKSGFGNILIQAVYTLIRLFHIFFAILVTFYIVVYGLFDGLSEVYVEYGIKAFILFLNAAVAFCMMRHIVSVQNFAPVIAGGWYFLASYHSYTLHIASTSVVYPLFVYLLFIIFFHFVFLSLRFFLDSPNTKQDV